MDVRRNYEGLKCYDVADRIIDACLTDEQKAILTFTQGKTEITPVEELNNIYGCRYLTYNLETTIKMFAITLSQ